VHRDEVEEEDVQKHDTGGDLSELVHFLQRGLPDDEAVASHEVGRCHAVPHRRIHNFHRLFKQAWARVRTMQFTATCA
jgi:hypothetical protein